MPLMHQTLDEWSLYVLHSRTFEDGEEGVRVSYEPCREEGWGVYPHIWEGGGYPHIWEGGVYPHIWEEVYTSIYGRRGCVPCGS